MAIVFAKPTPKPEPKLPATTVTEVKARIADLEKRLVGRPASGKVRVTLRLTPEVVEHFKATGDGWQARLDDALRKAI